MNYKKLMNEESRNPKEGFDSNFNAFHKHLNSVLTKVGKLEQEFRNQQKKDPNSWRLVGDMEKLAKDMENIDNFIKAK